MGRMADKGGIMVLNKLIVSLSADSGRHAGTARFYAPASTYFGAILRADHAILRIDEKR